MILEKRKGMDAEHPSPLICSAGTIPIRRTLSAPSKWLADGQRRLVIWVAFRKPLCQWRLRKILTQMAKCAHWPSDKSDRSAEMRLDRLGNAVLDRQRLDVIADHAGAPFSLAARAFENSNRRGR
jgi:hypothetical protein